MKALARPKFPLVLVEWDDAHATTQWQDPADVEETHAWTVSVGWLILDTATQVGIAAVLCSPDSDIPNSMAARMTIPRGMVRSIRVLHEGGLYRGGKVR